MAEFLNKPKPDHTNDPMHWMGKPIPPNVRGWGLAHCKEMGLDTVHGHACVEKVANALERDDPYAAMEASMQYLDLTGHYRLMAVLLAGVCAITPTHLGGEYEACDLDCPCDAWEMEVPK